MNIFAHYRSPYRVPSSSSHHTAPCSPHCVLSKISFRWPSRYIRWSSRGCAEFLKDQKPRTRFAPCVDLRKPSRATQGESGMSLHDWVAQHLNFEEAGRNSACVVNIFSGTNQRRTFFGLLVFKVKQCLAPFRKYTIMRCHSQIPHTRLELHPYIQ